MPPALRPAVPSQRLLRFLRAQSEGLSAFAECAAARLPPRRHACMCPAKTRSPDNFSTTPTTRREPTLQASFFGFRPLFPKVLTRQRITTPQQESSSAAGAPRYASSEQKPPKLNGRKNGSKPVWQEWLFGSETRGEGRKDDDIRVRLEEESGSIFQSRSLTAKAALDPRLRCTEVDGTGKVIMVDGELKKSELIARVGKRKLSSEVRVQLLTECRFVVRSASARSPKDRFLESSTYPCSAVRHSPQSPPSQSPH